jgi:hypothetical protein
MNTVYRYPGPQPFTTDQEQLFFGREEDIDALQQLILLEKLVVLFSKSGLGKSSLLNAGVIPQLHRQTAIQPFEVRFTSRIAESLTPLQSTLNYLEADTERPELLRRAFGTENSLWLRLKELQLQNGNPQFIIVFDQFEELFTYPEEAILDFKAALAEALYAEVPAVYRARLEQQYRTNDPPLFSEAELELLYEPFELHVLLAIRSDRMSLLNNLADHLPDILRTRYELKPLNRVQAEEAILNPAFLPDERYTTPAFDYQDEAIEQILDFLSQGDTEAIESFQLQILCQAIEKKVMEEGLRRVEVPHLGNMVEVYENYYENRIALIEDPQQRLGARKLIEEALIFEAEERRLSLYEGQIYEKYGFSPDLLRQLSNFHLLRAEPSLRGGYTYEIPHDTLVPSILRAKRSRLAEEQRRATAAAERRRAAELAELREETRRANRKRRRAIAIAVFSGLLAVAAIVASLWAVSESRRARRAEGEAMQQREKAVLLSDSLRQQFERATQARYALLLKDAQRLVAEVDYPGAIEQYDAAIEVAGEVDTTLLADGGRTARQERAATEELLAQNEAYVKQLAAGDDLVGRGVAAYPAARERYRQARTLATTPALRERAQNKLDALHIQINEEFNRLRRLARARLRAGQQQAACENIRLARTLLPQNTEIQQLYRENCQ